jgi:hypothetical protein
MITRVAVHLPVSLWLEQNSALDPFDAHFNGRIVRIYPPSQSAFDIRPDEHGQFNINELLKQLRPVPKPKVYEYVKMNGSFVKHADLLEIDFIQDVFDRRAGGPEEPAPTDVEAVVQNIIARLRYTTGAPKFREFALNQTYWITRYLNNEGNELPEQEGFVRARVHAPFEFTFSGLDAHSWAVSRSLDFTFQPHPWERLYLDAHFLLPEVGPALTLALSAIETAADELIRDRLHTKPEEAESLIRGRRLGQRLDEVARDLTGTSLKDDPGLWNSFNRLRLARNASSHAGRPLLDGKVIDRQVAFEIIVATEPILRWIEQLMSAGHQTRRDPNLPQWQFRSPVSERPRSE